MKTKKLGIVALVLGAWIGFLGLSTSTAQPTGESSATSPADCTPTCWKHPITGQIFCSYPCP